MKYIAEILIDKPSDLEFINYLTQDTTSGVLQLTGNHAVSDLEEAILKKCPSVVDLSYMGLAKSDSYFELSAVFSIDISPEIQHLLISFRICRQTHSLENLDIVIGSLDASPSFRSSAQLSGNSASEPTKSELWEFYGLSDLAEWLESEIQCSIDSTCVQGEPQQMINLKPLANSIWSRRFAKH